MPLCCIAQLDVSALSADSLHQKAVQLKELAQYDSALYYFNKAEAGYQAKANWTGIVKCQYGVGGIYTDRGNYQEAEKILLRAIALGQTHLDSSHTDVAEAHYILGYNYSQMPKLQEAENHYLNALEIFKQKKGEESISVGNTYAALGALYTTMKDVQQKAIDYLLKSIAVFEKAALQNSLEMARSFNDLANVYYQEEQMDKALSYHQKSLEIKQHVLEKNHPEIGISYYNLAQTYLHMGDLDRAATYYINTLNIDIANFGKDHPWVSQDYANIAQCYNIKGSYASAMQYARKSLDILRNAYGENNFRVARRYNTIGINYHSMGQYEQAVDSYKKALGILDQLPEKNISVEIMRTTAHGYNQLGLSLTKLGKYEEALSHHTKAFDVYKDLFGENNSTLGSTYMYMGDCQVLNQQPATALSYYQQALSVLKNSLGENHPEVAECLSKIGEIYLNDEDYEQALIYYQQALKGFAKDYEVTNVYRHPNIPAPALTPVVLTILHGKALALNKKYQATDNADALEFSFSTSLQAADWIDTLRIGYLKAGAQQNLPAHNMDIYETGIETAYALYQLNGDQQYLSKAFQLAERSKSFLLLAALQDSEAKHFAGIPDSVLQAEKDLSITLAFFEKKTQETLGKEEETFWRNKAFDAKQSYDSLISALAKNYPRYHQLKYNTAAIDLTTLQAQLLDTKDVLLEYFWGNDHIFLFVVNQHQPYLFKINQNELLTENINTVRNIIIQKQHQPTAFSEKAHHLYRVLVAPADSLIQNKNLLIIPDGPLSYLPFEVLPDKPARNASFFNLPYLVKNHSIHYAYSATVLAQNSFSREKKSPSRYIAFAPEFTAQVAPASAKRNYLISSQDQDTLREGLAPLKGAAREIHTINKLIGGDLYEGLAANEASFKRYAENYDIIHLATHAIVDDRYPLNSRMLFTVTEDTTEDGNLYAWELYNMQLNAQMAVLSACNTGLGKLQRGEGVMSLGRAFAYAGCPSVIMSLWPAQDQTTADLMNFFYAALTEGLPKNNALQQAKLQYLSQSNELFAHPFYWAGFVAQGNPDPLQLQGSFPILWMIGGLISLFAVSGFFFFYRARRHRLLKKSHIPTTSI